MHTILGETINLNNGGKTFGQVVEGHVPTGKRTSDVEMVCVKALVTLSVEDAVRVSRALLVLAERAESGVRAGKLFKHRYDEAFRQEVESG